MLRGDSAPTECPLSAMCAHLCLRISAGVQLVVILRYDETPAPEQIKTLGRASRKVVPLFLGVGLYGRDDVSVAPVLLTQVTQSICSLTIQAELRFNSKIKPQRTDFSL